MIKSILLKEWIKLRLYFISLVILLLAFIGYLAYRVGFEFRTIEPETMMWYRFVFLDYKPYEYFKWILFLVSGVISLAQFLPERVKNRIKIMTHLPLSLNFSLLLHFGIGISFLVLISGIYILGVGFIMNSFYPYPIVNIFLKDAFFYFLGSIILYAGISASLIEKNSILAAFKLVVCLFSLWLFSEINFSLLSVLWILVFLWFWLLSVDSLQSIKEQRLNKISLYSSWILGFLFIIFVANNLYFEKFHHQLTKFYIFYSPIKKQFAYQKNYGEHQFSYGLEDGSTFDRKTYESFLPFVYWTDLDIQKKLPIMIDGVNYDKKMIKDARLSFSYNPKEASSDKLKLFPYINSIKTQGIIPFPEEMFYPTRSKFLVFHHDGDVEEKLTKELNELSKDAKISFPVQKIWGRATNMKVYDLGYFIKDNNGEIFNIRRGDNKLAIKKLNLPKNVAYISINENSQRKLAGFAITENSEVFILDWNFDAKEVKLDKFDYKTMSLRLISNPKYYQIRYDNAKEYRSSVFDKEFNFIQKVKFE